MEAIVSVVYFIFLPRPILSLSLEVSRYEIVGDLVAVDTAQLTKELNDSSVLSASKGEHCLSLLTYSKVLSPSPSVLCYFKVKKGNALSR